MEYLKELLVPKTFNRVSHVAVVLWIMIGAIFFGIFADIESGEARYDFRCGGADGEHIDLVRGNCFELYEKKYNKYSLPVYGFVIANFCLIGTVCAIYSHLVGPTVDQLSRSIRDSDPERQPLEQENLPSNRYKLFIAYCCQLSARFVFGVLFIFLKTHFLYTTDFPSSFPCFLSSGENQPRNSTGVMQNSTSILHECHNQRATKKNSWMFAVLIVNGILVFSILMETVYILTQARKGNSFMENLNFLKAHLNPPPDNPQNATASVRFNQELLQRGERTELETNLAREPQQHEERTDCETNIAQSQEPHQHEERTERETNIPQRPQQQDESGTEHETNIPQLQPSEPEQLQKFIEKTKKMIREDTYQPPQLRSLFPRNPAKHLTLDQIYTNLVVVPDRASYDFTEDRRKNLELYARSGEKNKTLRGPEDILNHENKHVLIVGRPGIGKTLCCTKILRDWASNKLFHKTTDDEIHFDAAFYVKFRTLNTAPDLTLRELLTRSTYSLSNQLDDEVWNYIRKNPERVLFIFDGIDEFKSNSTIGTDDNNPQFRNSVDEKMPLSALYAKLTTGQLLNGAAVLTTTRPTAMSCIESLPFDKIYEILGFSSEQVEDYVTKFAEEKEAGGTLWRHINSNINLLSLCYIPASCFIVCSSLFQMLRYYGSKGLSLPTKLTDIYKKAVKIFYLRHNEEFRYKYFTREDFESDKLLPEVEEKFEKLEKMAFEGIKDGRLIFGGNEVHGMEDSALFHRLDDRDTGPFESERQFCFIHLTMQEFFAARYLANLSETELRNFVSANIKDGKYQLVFQFLAGLVNDKENLFSEIFTDLLPVKTEVRESKRYNEEWTEKTKVTCWPTKDEQELAVTLLKCINETSQMTTLVQRKLQQSNFKCVNFNDCHLTAVDCSSLVNVMENVRGISHFDLSFNNTGPLAGLEICKLLKCSNSQLSWLNLEANQLKAEGAKYLADAITSNNCQLRELNLRYNNITDTGAQHLAHAITSNNCQLRTLNLSNNNITDTGAQHLADAITSNNCQLHTLNLYNNNIRDTGAQHLAHAITSNNCQLHTLDLYNNNITDTGAQHLADAITSNNCQLHTLDLSHNYITATGAQHLADAITSNNCQLHTLYLLGNRNITAAGKQHALNLVRNSQSKCKLQF